VWAKKARSNFYLELLIYQKDFSEQCGEIKSLMLLPNIKYSTVRTLAQTSTRFSLKRVQRIRFKTKKMFAMKYFVLDDDL